MSLETNIKLAINCDYKKTQADGQITIDNLVKNLVLGMTSGTGADKADKLYHAQRSLSPGANEDLDLSGVLTDAFGDTLAAVKIKFLAFVNVDLAHVFTIKPGASNGFTGPFGASTHTMKLQPSNAANPAWLVLIADPNGYTVTPGTGDLINVAMDAGGSAGSYQIIIVAATA